MHDAHVEGEDDDEDLLAAKLRQQREAALEDAEAGAANSGDEGDLEKEGENQSSKMKGLLQGASKVDPLRMSMWLNTHAVQCPCSSYTCCMMASRDK
jgi:hypothetical protein